MSKPNMDEKILAKYITWALNHDIDDAKKIDPSSVITAPWVRMKCQYGCTGFGQRLCCPPFSPTFEETREILDSYSILLLLHSHRIPGDKKGMKKFNATIVDLEFQAFLDGYYKAWSMGCGPCQLCEKCDPKEACVNGKRARPSMEACGIDVYQTARDSEMPIQVARTRESGWDMYGLVMLT